MPKSTTVVTMKETMAAVIERGLSRRKRRNSEPSGGNPLVASSVLFIVTSHRREELNRSKGQIWW
ncbi:hypothetical protein LINGRAHAP2_LOCUS13872 [Linum grandiflorum]